MSFDCPYLFCPQCKACHAPYEDILNLRPGKYQYEVQKVAALLSSKDTYEESADMLNEIYRFGISPDTVHHLAGEVASRVNMVEIIPSSDEIRKIVEQISSKQHRKPIFVFAADGAMAPIRTEEKGVANCWKEVKGIRGYLLDKKQIVHLFSWHQISDKAEFASYLQHIKEQGLIPLDKVRLCFIGDGAGWIWEGASDSYAPHLIRLSVTALYCGCFLLTASCASKRSSNFALYLAQRSLSTLLALSIFHQAPERFSRTWQINLLALSMAPLPRG